jgi:hypothetical protein
MSLCVTPLTPDCEKELLRLIALIPDPDLSMLVATEPAFQTGGFRAGNSAALRARLQQVVCGSAVISDALRKLVARRSRSFSLTGLLSLEALVEARHAWAAILGGPVLLVALLLDPRKEVRDKAESWMQLAEPFLGLDPSDALARLRSLFADLSELTGTLPSGDVAPTRETWHQQKEKLESRLRDLQAENRRLKGVDDRFSRVTVQLKANEEKRSSAEQKLDAAEKQLRQKSREAEEALAELARETSRREDRLQAAIDAALAKEFHGWLANARAVECAAVDPTTQNDLLAQAESALKRQKEIDRHSGNHALLAERLERLQVMQARVRGALRNALRQAPELKTVEQSLEAEIKALSDLLEPAPAASPLEEAVLARIHAAKENDLPKLRELPELLASLHVLDEAAHARLKQAFQKRLAAIQALGVPLAADLEQRRDAAAHLERALSGQEPAILLIDGHNVLFGLPARYMPSRGKALPDADKRKRLVDDNVRITAPNPALRTWIVFDGPTRSDTQASPNVRVTYSGGQGEHRADGVILDNLRFFKTTAPEIPVLLASNDNDLCSAARRLGAADIAVLELGAYL